MPNATEQPTNRSRRGTLVILFLVAAIGVGLWFALERPKLAESASDAKPTTGDTQSTASGATSTDGDAQTAVSDATSTAGDAQTTASGAGSPTGDTQTTASGADSTADGAQTTASGADSTADGAQTTASGAGSTADGAQTTASGAGSTADGAQTTASGADSTADGAQTTATGADSTADGAQTTASGTDSTADGAQTTASGADSTASELHTAGVGTAASQDPTPPVDPDATGDATRIAAVEPGTAVVDEGPRVSAAPDSAVEKTPVDAPPDGEATAEVGILAAVGDAIKRLETAIEERLDSELQVSVTYDDSQANAPQPETTPTETVRTTESDATLTPRGTQAPDSNVGDDTSVAGTPGSAGAAPLDATIADDTTAADATIADDTTAADATMAGDTTATDATMAGDTTAADATMAGDTTAADATMADDTTAADATMAGDTTATDATMAASQDPTPPVDPDATGDATRIAAVEPGTAAVDEGPRVSAAPDSAVEETPVDAPPDGEAAGEVGILGAVADAIKRLETAIEERLDSELQVSVTYDDSQADAPQPETTPTEAVRTTESDATLTTGGTQAPDSDVGDDTSVAGTPGSGGAAPSDATMAGDTTAADATVAGDTTAADATVAADTTATDATIAADATATAATGAAEAEAKNYVETLTDTAPQTIAVDKADHFVTPEHVISLVPDDTIESVSVDELASDGTLSLDTTITVVREVEQVENAVAEQLIADSGGDLDRELRVQVTYDDSQEETGSKTVEEDDVQRITVREALERIRTEPDKPLPVIKTVRYFQVMTLKELLDSAVGEDAFLNVVTRPYRIESATLADLLQQQRTENPDSIFYLHTVLPTDDQGIWGIVHFGIIDNFARGMAIRRGEDMETYTVRIPRHADERLADRSSSFLGLMIDRKTRKSFVYNFRDNRMGRNPDRIYPGQELVIISFQPEELMSIYRHFTAS